MDEIKTKRIFIGNLSPNVCEDDLDVLLLPFGKKTASLEIIRKLQGAINCFAYASKEMTELSWLQCKNVLNQSIFMSHQLQIEEAKPSYQILNAIEKQKNELSFILHTKSRKKQTKNKKTYPEDKFSNKRKILFNLKNKINLKKLSGKASKKNILELTYMFDDTLGQWINGTCNQLKFDENNLKTKNIYLLKEIEANIFDISKENDKQSKQNKEKDLLILDKISNATLKKSSNSEIKLNLLNETNLKDVFASKVKKSVINIHMT
ncbi:unnamed protein product [Pneumocystis jirovecii]|uniref:RRM domain-containing protein n=1 Tax=Pneumocystis jirovecii TaxID=42068 RepID=L0P8Y1_PNEJI|nr:unnamed protein product [Pneumocystis jirovecii]